MIRTKRAIVAAMIRDQHNEQKMIVEALIQHLEATPALTALLAYHPRTKGAHAIYAGAPAEGTSSPLLIVTMQDETSMASLQSNDNGLADATLEIEIITEESQGYGKGSQIREQLRLAMVTTGDTWGIVEVQSCRLEALVDSDYAPPEQGNNWVFQGGWNARVWFNQSAIGVF